eukprot:1747469-Karenia_brevis.AAC.1
MGKPQGGTRPIALMPMLYRIWTKIRIGDQCRPMGCCCGWAHGMLLWLAALPSGPPLHQCLGMSWPSTRGRPP